MMIGDLLETDIRGTKLIMNSIWGPGSTLPAHRLRSTCLWRP